MFRESVRRFYKEKVGKQTKNGAKTRQQQVVPHHEQWEKDGQVSRELWKEAGSIWLRANVFFFLYFFKKKGAAGFLGVTMPESVGGAGVDIMYSAIGWEEQMVQTFPDVFIIASSCSMQTLLDQDLLCIQKFVCRTCCTMARKSNKSDFCPA